MSFVVAFAVYGTKAVRPVYGVFVFLYLNGLLDERLPASVDAYIACVTFLAAAVVTLLPLGLGVLVGASSSYLAFGALGLLFVAPIALLHVGATWCRSLISRAAQTALAQ